MNEDPRTVEEIEAAIQAKLNKILDHHKEPKPEYPEWLKNRYGDILGIK